MAKGEDNDSTKRGVEWKPKMERNGSYPCKVYECSVVLECGLFSKRRVIWQILQWLFDVFSYLIPIQLGSKEPHTVLFL